MNDVESSQAEIEAGAEVKAIINNANEKAKEIRKKCMKLQAQMKVLKKKKEKEGKPTEVQLLVDEMRKGRNLHQSNNNNHFFKRAELKHGNFKPGETNLKEWYEVFEMSAQSLPGSAKLLLLQQSFEGAAIEFIRNIIPRKWRLQISNNQLEGNLWRSY